MNGPKPDRHPRAAGLKELADALGLSTSTVSRAFNRHPAVNPETRARVLELADRTGFRPNSTARRLRRQRTDSVAFVLSPPQSDYANQLFLQIIGGLDAELRAHDKMLLVTAARDRQDELDIIRNLIEGSHVDGLAFGRLLRDDPRVDYLTARGLPFAVLGGGADRLPFPAVDLNHRTFTADAARRLAALGHRRIALLSGPAEFIYCSEADAGICTAGLDVEIVRTDLTADGGEAAALDLLKAGRVSATVCINDVVAFGVYRAAARLGIRIGRDISVIGAHDILGASHVSPPLATYRMQARRGGARLGQRLLACMGSGAASYTVERFEPEFVDRASIGGAR